MSNRCIHCDSDTPIPMMINGKWQHDNCRVAIARATVQIGDRVQPPGAHAEGVVVGRRGANALVHCDCGHLEEYEQSKLVVTRSDSAVDRVALMPSLDDDHNERPVTASEYRWLHREVLSLAARVAKLEASDSGSTAESQEKKA